MGFATFDGTGGTYFTRTALPATATYPFWVGAWIRVYKWIPYGANYTLWSSSRADNSQGNECVVIGRVPKVYSFDAGGISHGTSAEAVIPDPYTDFVLCEYRSSTDRRVWINNVQEGTDAVSRTPDLSTGSPITRIGIEATGGNPFKGGINNVTFGTGVLSGADRALLATQGVNYTTVTGITNWYPLASNGNDSIGGANMTDHGGVVYDSTTSFVSPPPPARNQLIYNQLKQPNLLSGLPTVTANQTPPTSTSGWTNFARCDYLDIAFTGNVSVWNTRIFHFVPTSQLSTGGHAVFVDGGHELLADWPTFGTDQVVKQLIALGYDVFATQLPLEGPTDPGYNGTVQLHNSFDALISPTANPKERWIGPQNIAMNYVVSVLALAKRSFVGLSGGGQRTVDAVACDIRFNHAGVCVRGSIADRRSLEDDDFESFPYPQGYKAEDIYKLSAAGNRIFTLVHHPTDTCCFGQFDTGAGNGAYISASGYDTKFLAPIRAAQPFCQISFYVDLGSSTHSFTQDAIDHAILPALSGSLTTVYYIDKLRAGVNYNKEFFTQNGSPAWYADTIFIAPNGAGTSVILTGVSGTGAIGLFDIPQNVTLSGVQGTGSVGTFGKIISSNVTLDSLRGIGRIGHFVGLGPIGGVPGNGLALRLGLGL